VLAAMVDELNNKQIAEKLTISHSTIKSQFSNILLTLGIASRTEAVAMALRNHSLPVSQNGQEILLNKRGSLIF
jgi:DNA-binding NarL/FixJ family response regulator